MIQLLSIADAVHGSDGVSALEGARHRVVCVDLDIAAEAGHVHVTRIGTRDPGGTRRRWSLVEMVSTWREGDTFFTRANPGGGTAELRPSVCPRCRLVTVAAEPSGALHGLPACPADAS